MRHHRTLSQLLPLVAFLGWPLMASAQPPPPPPAPSDLSALVKANFTQVADFALLKGPGADQRNPLDLFGLYLNIMLGFVGIVFVVQIVHGGYLWMTAGGNEEQVQKAQKKLTNGTIGAVIIFLAFIITAFALSVVCEQANVVCGFETTAPPPP